MNEEAIFDFLAWLFEFTEHPVEIRSLPKDGGKIRRVFSRDPEVIGGHVAKFSDYHHYYGVATRLRGHGTGERADCAELPAVWCEVDTRKNGMDQQAVIDAALSAMHPPSCILSSGGGLHLLWKLREPIDLTSTDVDEDIEVLNRQLLGVFGGDLGTHDIPRILRLPGTVNLKYPELPVAAVLHRSSATYEPSDLADWLAIQSPLVTLPPRESEASASPDPFAAYAKAAGFKAPLDVEALLKRMTYQGNGTDAIHQTQLLVSASMVGHGHSDAEILDLLLSATRAAAGPHGEKWNWRREERTIQTAIDGARKKGYDRPKPAPEPDQDRPRPAGRASAAGHEGATVHDLAAEREKKQQEQAKAKKEAADEEKKRIQLVGDAAKLWWENEHGRLITSDGEFWTYSNGYWSVFGPAEEHRLRVGIMGVVLSMKFNPESKLLNGAFRYVMEHPDWASFGTKWDQSGLIVCRNGCIDPATGSIYPHLETHWATYAIDCDIDPAATCPHWMMFLEGVLAGLAERERRQTIDTLAEWFGAALVRGKSREMTKALIVHGPSYTGKTQLAMVARALFGGKPCGIRVRDFNGSFPLEPLLHATAWIADDAVSSGEFMDAEVFKILVTGEPTSVGRKGKTNVEKSFDIPILLTANHLPKIKDQSDAVYNRSLIFPMNIVFPEAQAGTRPLYETFIAELAGILNWAIAGYQRLLARRRFDPPAHMRKASASFQADNNPTGQWISEAFEANPGFMVDRRDILACFKAYCLEEFGADYKPPGPRFLFPSIRQAIPTIEDHKSNSRRYVAGLKFTPAGIYYVERAADLFAGMSGEKGSGETGANLNKLFYNTQPESGKARF